MLLRSSQHLPMMDQYPGKSDGKGRLEFLHFLKEGEETWGGGGGLSILAIMLI